MLLVGIFDKFSHINMILIWQADQKFFSVI